MREVAMDEEEEKALRDELNRLVGLSVEEARAGVEPLTADVLSVVASRFLEDTPWSVDSVRQVDPTTFEVEWSMPAPVGLVFVDMPWLRDAYEPRTLKDKVRWFRADHGAGCCLHIVVEDGNIDHDDVMFCLHTALQRKHPECIELARQLLKVSKVERADVLGMDSLCMVCRDLHWGPGATCHCGATTVPRNKKGGAECPDP